MNAPASSTAKPLNRSSKSITLDTSVIIRDAMDFFPGSLLVNATTWVGMSPAGTQPRARWHIPTRTGSRSSGTWPPAQTAQTITHGLQITSDLTPKKFSLSKKTDSLETLPAFVSDRKKQF